MANLDDILTVQKNGVVAINGVQRLLAQFLDLVQPSFAAVLKVKYVAVGSTYQVQLTDCVVDCVANTFTVTLPGAATIQGQVFTVKNSGAGVITVAAAGADLIDGAATQSLPVQYQTLSMISTGAGWSVL
jgi:hypothetical protein